MRRIVLVTIFVIAAISLTLPLQPAAANSAPPPAVNWFYIEYPEDARLRVEGAQVWGCADEICEQPELIQTWGQCSSPECLPPGAEPVSGAATIASRFECAPVSGEMRCRSAAFQYGYPFFRLAVQFDDRLRTHPNPLPLPGQGAYGETHHWRVTVVDPDRLALAETEARPRGGLPVPPFAAFFGITLVIELLVAGIYAAIRWKLEFPTLILRLVLITVINLLTYPVVWGFFPTLQRFSAPGYRSAGWGLMAFTLLMGGLLWVAINASTNRRRIVAGVITALTFAGGLICLTMTAFAASYGGYDLTAGGLPPLVVLLLAETYAVVVEGVLIFGFTRREVGLREALLLSLGMNAASFLVGLLLAW